MKFSLYCFAMLTGVGLVRSPVRAQEQEKINPDRRDFTTGTGIVSGVQIESGATVMRRGDAREYNLGETQIRVPLSKRIEARVQVPLYRIERDEGRRAGIDDATVEARFLLNKKAKSEFALQLTSRIPSGSHRVAERRYQPGVIAAETLMLSPKTELLLNIGAIRASESQQRFTQVFIASSLRTDLSDNVNVFAEIYAFNKERANGSTQKFVAAGAVYYLNSHTALDARLGLGLNNKNGGPDYLYSVGISRLF